jgi:hypothetical protein
VQAQQVADGGARQVVLLDFHPPPPQSIDAY